MKSGRKDVASSFLYAGRPVVGWSGNLLMNALGGALDEVVVAQNNGLLRAKGSDSTLDGSPGNTDVAAKALGMALTGRRVGSVMSDVALAEHSGVVRLAAKMHTPLCIVSVPDPDRPGHDSFEGFARAIENGAAGLIAGDLQETIDFALLATRISERVLVPAICAADVVQSRWDVASVLAHESGLVEAFLGKAVDEIPSPTPAQDMAFGSRRRRVPALVSSNSAVGLNPTHGPAHEHLASAGDAAFFGTHLAPIIDEAFDEFGSLTGRFYSSIETYRTEDADVVLLAYGSVGTQLLKQIDSLRSSLRVKVGGVRIVVANPLPSEKLRAILRGRMAAAVVDTGTLSSALSYAVRGVGDADCPQVSTARIGMQSRPSLGHFEAIVRRMMRDGNTPFSDFVVPDPDPARTRIPGLERTDQLIRKSYPELPFINSGPASAAGGSPTTAYFFGNDLTLLGETVGTFVRAYSTALGEKGAGQLLDGRPAAYAASLNIGGPLAAVFDLDLLAHDHVLDRLARNSTVVVPVIVDKKQFWTTVPEAFRIAAVERELSILGVGRLDAEAAEEGELQKHLRAFALLGGVARCIDDKASPQSFGDSLLRVLTNDGLPARMAERLVDSFNSGFQEAFRISHSHAPARPLDNPETPWTLRGVVGSTSTVTDPARFWNSVGFEAASGRTGLLRPDPYLACRIVPAGTSVETSRRAAVAPVWLPENCTGCGSCWTFCPHSALPTVAFPSDQLLEVARSRVESHGGSTTQVQRLGKAIGKRVHKLVADDGLHRFTSAETVVREAGDQILSAAKLDAETDEAARSELESVIAELESLPIAKAQAFFESREDANRGSGLLLSIAVDADACTGCGICSAVCPDAAFDPSPMTPVEPAAYRHTRTLVSDLSARQEEFGTVDELPELSRRMMTPDAYYASVGGGGAEPGSGLTMAVHLIAGLAAAGAQARRNVMESEIDHVADGLKDAIQKVLSKTSQINDFNAFASQIRDLSRSGSKVDLRALIDTGSDIDTERLQRLSDAILDLENLQARHAANRGGSSGFVAVLGDAPSLLADAAFPQNPFAFSWINADGSDPVDLARGISEGLTREALDTVRRLRKARRIADDTFDPAEQSPTELGDLSETESAFLPQVCLFTESMNGRLTASLRGGSPVCVFWLDRLPVESVGESPLATGWNPNLVYAQTVPSAADHFAASVDGALRCRGTSLTRVYAPVPASQEFAPRDTVARMEAAVASRVFPLISYDPNTSLEWNERWSLDGNPNVTEDWTTKAESVTTAADWLAVEGRFRGLFEPIATSSDGRQVEVSDYLSATGAEQPDMTPYVELEDVKGKTRRLRVGAEALLKTERVRLSWRLLQELAAVRSHLLDVARETVEADVRQQFEAEQAAIQSEMEARIRELQADYEAELRGRLESRLLQMSGFDGTSDTLAGWLSNLERVGRDDAADAADGG